MESYATGTFREVSSEGISAEAYRRRRARFVEAMLAGRSDAVAVFPSAVNVPRDNHNPIHFYRPDTDLHYLTGLEELRCVAVLSEKGFTLFVEPNVSDIWGGPKTGLEGAKIRYGADQAFDIGELDARLPGLVANHKRLFYRANKDADFDRRITNLLVQGRNARRVSTRWPTEVIDSGVILHEQRLRKDEEELALLRRAAEVTEAAHRAAMATAKPGRFEYEVEAAFFQAIRRTGGRPAYGIIVGTGPNTSIVQYRRNDSRIEDGDLVMVDGACMFGQLGCDVTRTFPANGTFSKPQRRVYETVLEAQLAGIAVAHAGRTVEDIQTEHAKVFTRQLLDMGLLKGSYDEAFAKQAHKRFSHHRSTHWLGMDAHDVGVYYDDAGVDRPMLAGMMMSNEPGLYIGHDADVPPEYRGVCVRIEDDVLIGETEATVLTGAIPKTVADVERACRST